MHLYKRNLPPIFPIFLSPLWQFLQVFSFDQLPGIVTKFTVLFSMFCSDMRFHFLLQMIMTFEEHLPFLWIQTLALAPKYHSHLLLLFPFPLSRLHLSVVLVMYFIQKFICN